MRAHIDCRRAGEGSFFKYRLAALGWAAGGKCDAGGKCERSEHVCGVSDGADILLRSVAEQKIQATARPLLCGEDGGNISACDFEISA